MSPGKRPIGTPKLTSRPTTTSTIPITIRKRPTLLSNLHPAKKVPDLECGGLRRVRAVRRIPFERGAELLAQGTRISFRRIGGAHQRTPFGNRIWRFERHDDARAGRHEVRQRGEER